MYQNFKATDHQRSANLFKKSFNKYLTNVVNKMLVFINCLPKVFSKVVAKY